MSLKIALSSTYHVNEYQGGNEVYTQSLAIALTNIGHQVLYLTSRSRSCIRDDSQTYSTFTFKGRHIYARHLAERIANFRPDIFHFTGSGVALAFAAFQLKKNYNFPIVHTYQAPSNPTCFLNYIGSKLENYLIAKSVDAIITTTPTIENHVKAKFPQINSKFVPMSLKSQFFSCNCAREIARKRLKLPYNKKIILFVGRLDPNHYYKGLEDLITATENLPNEFSLVVVGGGVLMSRYQNLTSKKRLDARVYFTGEVNDEILSFYYAACDVFVLPSTSNSEGFGLVLLEAMAMGKPVITTTVIGSYSWFKNQDVADFVPPSSPFLLSKSIERAVYNPNLKRICHAKDFARTFTPERLANLTVEAYCSVLK